MRSYTTIFVCIFLMCSPALSQDYYNQGRQRSNHQNIDTEDLNLGQNRQDPNSSQGRDLYNLRHRPVIQDDRNLDQQRLIGRAGIEDFGQSKSYNPYDGKVNCDRLLQDYRNCKNQNSPFENNNRDQPARPVTTPSYDEEDEERVYPNSVTDFSLKLLQNIPTSSDSNVVVSPLSVQYLLAVLENGSGGKTKEQLRNVVGEKDAKTLKKVLKNDDGLKTALGIFVDNKIKLNRRYITKIEDFKPEVKQYDFGSTTTKSQINQWAEDNTESKIKDLIPQGQDLRGVEMVLATAIYFNNVWKYKFHPIGEMPFTTGNGQKISPSFMEISQNIPFMEHSFNRIDGVMISLPYENAKYEMVLIVPNEIVNLDDLVKQIKPEQLNRMLSTTGSVYPRFTKLQMPKFNVKTSESLVEPLKKMNLVDIFGAGSNLTGITSSANLFVSEILQQATLEVDEIGTVAAAATSALLIPLSADSKPRPRIFTIDRPFLVIILDTENKSPLFVSKINNPQL